VIPKSSGDIGPLTVITCGIFSPNYFVNYFA